MKQDCEKKKRHGCLHLYFPSIRNKSFILKLTRIENAQCGSLF